MTYLKETCIEKKFTKEYPIKMYYAHFSMQQNKDSKAQQYIVTLKDEKLHYIINCEMASDVQDNIFSAYGKKWKHKRYKSSIKILSTQIDRKGIQMVQHQNYKI